MTLPQFLAACYVSSHIICHQLLSVDSACQETLCLAVTNELTSVRGCHCLPSPAVLFRQKALGLARPLLQAGSRQIHYMAHSDQLCMKCSDNQGLFFWALLDREQSCLFIALKAPHLLLRLMQGHWAKIHLSCRPSFLKRKPMVRRLRVGGVERTQAR